MLIVNQKRTALINLNNATHIVKEITIDKNKIQYWADTTTNDTILLGEYENTPEHEKIIEKMAQSAGALNVFYMPHGIPKETIKN